MSRARQKSARAGQRGNFVAAVTAFGLAGTLAMTAVMNSSVVLEDRAIDANLAQVRAYWGAMGQFNYVMSRTAYSRACEELLGCGGSAKGKDDEKAVALQGYLNEISGYRTLTYREEPSAYFIRLSTGVASEDDTPGKHPWSGHVMLRSGLSGTQSTLPVLADLAPRLPTYELRLCVGVPYSSSLCGPIGSNNGGEYTDDYSVKRLIRLPN